MIEELVGIFYTIFTTVFESLKVVQNEKFKKIIRQIKSGENKHENKFDKQMKI